MSTTTTYMLLLWGDPDACVDLEAAFAAHGTFTEQCALQGHEIVGGEELASPGDARLLTVADGTTQVTDGPYAETTEQLGGFYLIRTSDPDGLLRLAEPLALGTGTLELRPVAAHDAPVGAPDAEAAVTQPVT